METITCERIEDNIKTTIFTLTQAGDFFRREYALLEGFRNEIESERKILKEEKKLLNSSKQQLEALLSQIEQEKNSLEYFKKSSISTPSPSHTQSHSSPIIQSMSLSGPTHHEKTLTIDPNPHFMDSIKKTSTTPGLESDKYLKLDMILESGSKKEKDKEKKLKIEHYKDKRPSPDKPRSPRLSAITPRKCSPSTTRIPSSSEDPLIEKLNPMLESITDIVTKFENSIRTARKMKTGLDKIICMEALQNLINIQNDLCNTIQGNNTDVDSFLADQFSPAVKNLRSAVQLAMSNHRNLDELEGKLFELKAIPLKFKKLLRDLSNTSDSSSELSDNRSGSSNGNRTSRKNAQHLRIKHQSNELTRTSSPSLTTVKFAIDTTVVGDQNQNTKNSREKSSYVYDFNDDDLMNLVSSENRSKSQGSMKRKNVNRDRQSNWKCPKCNTTNSGTRQCISCAEALEDSSSASDTLKRSRDKSSRSRLSTTKKNLSESHDSTDNLRINTAKPNRADDIWMCSHCGIYNQLSTPCTVCGKSLELKNTSSPLHAREGPPPPEDVPLPPQKYGSPIPPPRPVSSTIPTKGNGKGQSPTNQNQSPVNQVPSTPKWPPPPKSITSPPATPKSPTPAVKWPPPTATLTTGSWSQTTTVIEVGETDWTCPSCKLLNRGIVGTCSCGKKKVY